MKFYKVIITKDNPTAKPHQVINGYLGNIFGNGKVAEYEHKEAIKKAQMFNGEIEFSRDTTTTVNFLNCKPTIDELYESRFSDDKNKQFKIGVKFTESPVIFGIVLTGGDKRPDCKISSFANNIYFRTRNGEYYKKYKSIKGISNAVKNIAKNYGYTFEYLQIEKGEPDRL